MKKLQFLFMVLIIGGLLSFHSTQNLNARERENKKDTNSSDINSSTPTPSPSSTPDKSPTPTPKQDDGEESGENSPVSSEKEPEDKDNRERPVGGQTQRHTPPQSPHSQPQESMSAPAQIVPPAPAEVASKKVVTAIIAPIAPLLGIKNDDLYAEKKLSPKTTYSLLGLSSLFFTFGNVLLWPYFFPRRTYTPLDPAIINAERLGL